jgi:hypothetical protein
VKGMMKSKHYEIAETYLRLLNILDSSPRVVQTAYLQLNERSLLSIK